LLGKSEHQKERRFPSLFFVAGWDSVSAPGIADGLLSSTLWPPEQLAGTSSLARSCQRFCSATRRADPNMWAAAGGTVHAEKRPQQIIDRIERLGRYVWQDT
jgi:hypothetical protein